MLKNTLLCAVALVSIPSLAHAGDGDNFTNRMSAGDALRSSAMTIADLQRYGLQHLGSLFQNEAGCRLNIDAHKDSVGPDETIFNSEFRVIPFAVDRHDGDGDNDRYEFPFKKAGKLCDLLASTIAHLQAAEPLSTVAIDVPAPITDDGETSGWYEIVEHKSERPSVDRHCNEQVDAVIKAGVAQDESITFYEGVAHTPEEIRTLCLKGQAQDQENADKVLAWAEAKYAEQAALYKKVGIKGDRLDLFMYRDAISGWFYASGCTTEVTSPKALAKAKKLFMWLDGDGYITVRTYKFKGNKYTQTEKEYSFPETAYAGCR